MPIPSLESVFYIMKTKGHSLCLSLCRIFNFFCSSPQSSDFKSDVQKHILKTHIPDSETFCVCVCFVDIHSNACVKTRQRHPPGDIVRRAGGYAGLYGVSAVHTHCVKGLVVTVAEGIEVDVGLGSCSRAGLTCKRTHRERKQKQVK